MSESVTVHIESPKVVTSIMKVGDVVRIVGQKRVWLTVYKQTDSEPNEESYIMKPLYKPSPSSVLRKKKSVFSKVKMKIEPK